MEVTIRMKYERLLLLDAIVFFIYSLGALLFTREMLDLHGVILNEAGLFTAQIAGAAFFAFSALNLTARRLNDAQALNIILNANLVKHAVCLFVCVSNIISGGLSDNRSLGFLLLFLLFTSAHVVFYVSRRRSLEERSVSQ